MYSWGGSTSNWKKPGGYNYDSARAPYLDKLASDSKAKGGRSYTRRSSPDLKLVDPRGKAISSNSENPIVVGIDVTGSMASWPAEIFDRLPLFYQTLSQYRPDVEFVFAAIGDATIDQYPLQVNNFGKGVDLEDHVNALYPEGGGGGHTTESYELFGYFALNKIAVAKAKSPFLFIYGDESFYRNVSPEQVKHYIGDTLQAPVDSQNVWQGLLQKFNVYFLHKPYGHGGESDIDSLVKGEWSNALGSQRVVELPSYDRAVDIAMGIVAKHWGQYDDFDKSLTARHPDDPDARSSVHKSLRYIPGGTGTKSIKLLPPGGTNPADW